MMDNFQATVVSLGMIVIVLLIIMFLWHILGPKVSAWVCSNREEKIGLSKCKLFNANGYLIHSGSDILLSSTGSFKRFDSIDHDYKEVGQTSITSPAWNIPAPDIPPQPLRPAPAPAPSTKEIKKCLEKSTKQQSCDGMLTNVSTVIPRPTAKRQLSSPAGTMMPINLSEAVRKISSGPRACTNPFLNGSISIPEKQDNQQQNGSNTLFIMEQERSQSVNPFTIFKSNSTNINSENDCISNKNWNEAEDYYERSSESTNNSNNLTNSLDKFLDSPIANGFDSIDKVTINNFRARSMSETEAVETESIQIVNSLNQSTNPFKTRLHKTVSETYLEQYLLNRRNSAQVWMLSKGLSRQNSNVSLPRSLGSQSSIGSNEYSDLDNMKRAMSCDSVSSDSSVVLADLEQPTPAVTGLLCVGLQYDKNSQTDEGIELVVTVMEAKQLIFPSITKCLDTFVRIYLVPDETEALQTKMFKNSACPTYNETFCFWLSKKRSRRSLWFHLYHSDSSHTLLGEAELKIIEITRPITTWLSLSDSRHNNNLWGELMFSLSYLPTAERLTVVVVKARNLKMAQESKQQDIQNVFIKVYLLKNDKKVFKKKTCTKRTERSPIYNESMIFSVPPYMLKSIQIRLTVANASDPNCDNGFNISPIGHVIVGSNTTGKGLRHWNQMLSSLRKPVAMWHPIRQINKNKQTDITSNT